MRYPDRAKDSGPFGCTDGGLKFTDLLCRGHFLGFPERPTAILGWRGTGLSGTQRPPNLPVADTRGVVERSDSEEFKRSLSGILRAGSWPSGVIRTLVWREDGQFRFAVKSAPVGTDRILTGILTAQGRGIHDRPSVERRAYGGD